MIKVGDLGISKALSQTMEQCKSVVGTPHYMAPEGKVDAMNGMYCNADLHCTCALSGCSFLLPCEMDATCTKHAFIPSLHEECGRLLSMAMSCCSLALHSPGVHAGHSEFSQCIGRSFAHHVTVYIASRRTCSGMPQCCSTLLHCHVSVTRLHHNTQAVLR